MITYDVHVCSSYMFIMHDHHICSASPGPGTGTGPRHRTERGLYVGLRRGPGLGHVGLGRDPDRDMGHQADGAFTMLLQCTYFRMGKKERRQDRSRER